MGGGWCAAITASGAACRRRALSQSMFCEYHINPESAQPKRGRRGSQPRGGSGAKGGGRPKGTGPRSSAPPPAPVVPDGAVTVYTDGACRQSQIPGDDWAWGPGGWAWVEAGGTRRGAGGEGWTTNQRMELAAALDAVRSYDGPLLVVSDSQYLVRCFAERWWAKWQRNRWMRGERNSEQVKNQDLWRPLVDRALKYGSVFQWVKGHNGDRWNEEADRLAVAAVPRAAEGRVGAFKLPL